MKYLGFMLGVYLTGAFVGLEANPLLWSDVARFTMAVLYFTAIYWWWDEP